MRDVSQAGSALAHIMNTRLDMCRSKGFDAVEFDNMGGYANSTGFSLTAAANFNGVNFALAVDDSLFQPCR